MALGVEQAVAEILRDGSTAPDRLVDGLATLRSWDLYDAATEADRHIFVAEEPDAPDACVTVVLEGGGPPRGGGDPNAVGRLPAFTVRSRSTTYEDALALAHQVYEILDYFQGLVNAVPFFRILANFEPLALGRDRDDRGGRWIFSQTFRSVTKRYALS